MPKFIYGFPVKFHLDSRLTKLETRWKRIQLLQDDLLDRFNTEHSPLWTTHEEPNSTANDFTPSSSHGDRLPVGLSVVLV